MVTLVMLSPEVEAVTPVSWKGVWDLSQVWEQQNCLFFIAIIQYLATHAVSMAKITILVLISQLNDAQCGVEPSEILIFLNVLIGVGSLGFKVC